MSTPKHTPGPWHIGLKPGPMVYGPQGEQIVGINVMLDGDEVLANAKFIAAAPAMYEALKAIVGQQTPNRWGYDAAGIALSDEWRAQARAALAQAEGNL